MRRSQLLNPPSEAQTVDALCAVGDLLGRTVAYHRDGRFYFRLDARWTLALSADSVGRFRLDACHQGHRAASLWVRHDHSARLADLVTGLREEVEALASA